MCTSKHIWFPVKRTIYYLNRIVINTSISSILLNSKQEEENFHLKIIIPRISIKLFILKPTICTYECTSGFSWFYKRATKFTCLEIFERLIIKLKITNILSHTLRTNLIYDEEPLMQL
jgi:hypothetical protein